MDVFVIPLGRDRYELYCEQPVELDEHAHSASPGLVGRLLQRFSAWLRATEERQRTHAVEGSGDQAKTRFKRLQDRCLAWMVERVAEQRLLWNLRGRTTAVAVHPQDMTFDQVKALIQRDLQRDYERHRRWLIIDGIGLVVFIALSPLFLLIPGVANLPALYFAFRVVGHWLSLRGAAQGLRRVTWTSRPCPPLGELREVATMEPRARDTRIQDIASRLQLQHLATFFERMAVRPA
jgi:hypothetical protein